MFKVAKSGGLAVPCVDIQCKYKSFAYLKKTHLCLFVLFLVLSKRPLFRLDIRRTSRESYRNLTLQCSSTSWYALFISSSKARNCLCVAAERATRKLSIFVTVLVLGVSTPQFYSFLRRIASLFTLICLCQWELA